MDVVNNFLTLLTSKIRLSLRLHLLLELLEDFLDDWVISQANNANNGFLVVNCWINVLMFLYPLRYISIAKGISYPHMTTFQIGHPLGLQ